MRTARNLKTIRNGLPAVILCLVLAAGCTRQPIYPSPAITGDHAAINISDLELEVPRFFTYRFQGKNISFFVIKLDERIISFLDACASCYNHKQGYQHTDTSVTCRFCNMQFSIYKLEKGLGGCYPIRIDGIVRGGTYVIPLKVLSGSGWKF